MMTRHIIHFLLACVFCSTSMVSQDAFDSHERPYDRVITKGEVATFSEFEQAVLSSGTEAGISHETAMSIAQDFQESNSKRIVPFVEWRTIVLELLYKNEIPYPIACKYLTRLIRRTEVPIDTGFLDSVRYMDLGDMSVYKLGRHEGVSPPIPIKQPLPLYSENG